MNREKIWPQNVNVTQLIFSFVFQSPPDFFLLLKIWRRSVNDIRRGSRTILPLDVQFNASGSLPVPAPVTWQLQSDLPEHGSFPALDSETSAASKNVFMIIFECFVAVFSISGEVTVFFCVCLWSPSLISLWLIFPKISQISIVERLSFQKIYQTRKKKGLTRNSLLGVSSIG